MTNIRRQGDASSRTFRVEADLPADTKLMIGMTVDVDIVISQRANALLVPAGAVAHGPSQGGRPGAPFVFVVEDGRARRVDVKTGAVGTAKVEIVSGLEGRRPRRRRPVRSPQGRRGRARFAMTPLPLSIAFAHLWARKRQTVVSIGGVMLGVAIFIGIGGMMNGFHSYFLSQLVDTNPHIVISDEIRQAAPQPLTTLHPGRRGRDPPRAAARSGPRHCGRRGDPRRAERDGRRRGGAVADRPGHLAPCRARLLGDRHRRRRPARSARDRHRP